MSLIQAHKRTINRRVLLICGDRIFYSIGFKENSPKNKKTLEFKENSPKNKKTLLDHPPRLKKNIM